MVKKKILDKKLNAAEGVRDAFGQLLALAVESVNLELVLEYIITPTPLSIVHPDGTLAKTDKSLLTKLLECYQTEEVTYSTLDQ